jgi:alkylation response protein AidB-like acyl-CoA dehydrogenase
MNAIERLNAQLGLPEDEAMLLESVRAFARAEIAPRAAHFDESKEFPWANVEGINRLGLNAMFIPQAYGGAGLSYLAYLACVRELSAACASTGIIWATNYHATKPIIEFGSEELKERLLPTMLDGGLAALVITESGAGSDATGMRTTFREDGDHLVVNGSKIFITNGDVADLYLVFGKWAGVDDQRKAISCMVIEKGTPGLSVGRLEDKLGHRASSTATLNFDECRVPKRNLICGPGEGLPMLLASLNHSRPSIGAHALGIAHAAFEDSVAYINGRRQSGKRIIEFQGIQFLLADLASELALCDAWLLHVARLVDQGVKDIGVEASILKMRASDLAMRMATEAIQMHGGYGYCKEYRVERLFRDAKIAQIWEGTNQIHRQIIGRHFIER